MKSLHTLAICATIFLVGCAETIEFEKLNKRDWVYYKVNSETPYTGNIIKHYDNGQKAMKGYLKNGVFHGRFIAWHENGQKKQDFNYKDGELHGINTQWHKNGQKEYEQTGEDGTWVKWYENGQKKEEAG